jgi:hypothetical protein
MLLARIGCGSRSNDATTMEMTFMVLLGFG